MSDTREFRDVRAQELRMVPGEDGAPGRMEGYAAVFNVWSEDLGGFRERIAPGAFADSLGRGDDVLALHDHDTGQLLGRRSAGTLRIAEDEVGLRVSVDLPDTGAGRDVLAYLQRGDLAAMSFGFRTRADDWRHGDAMIERTLITLDLFEVSVVAMPAYPQTSASARSAAAALAEQDVEAAAAALRARHDLMRRRLRLASA